MASETAKIPTVLSADELLDKAFGRASKVSIGGSDALDRLKKTSLGKVTAIGDIIKDTLDKYVDTFPRIEKEEDFFPELVNLVVGLDQYKKSLGAVKWASNRTEILRKEALRKIRRSKDPRFIDMARNEFYGRISSVLRQISKDLLFLQSARDKIRKLPYVSAKVPTLVVAGFPNVGKSRIVTELSTAEPEIAPYPFTTKGIVIGHMDDGWRRFQVIDTPGLLDRELEERNAIERQAILALKYLTHVILFVIDPTETCGYTLEKQTALLESVQRGFGGVEIIIAESKSDMLHTDSGRLSFSSETGENVDTLRKTVVDALRRIDLGEEEDV
ncbi:MAG: GTP-binding protein [Thermoplasmatales archaeon]|jgi:nucleolar GTP-binding protein|nr:GTP-binding protein [Thermoplasmatales archaeon]